MFYYQLIKGFMYSLLLKKYLFLILPLPGLLAACGFFVIPLAVQVHDYVTLYRQALVEPFPDIKLFNGRLEFVDPVPVTITISDAVQIICDKDPDTLNFTTATRNSVLISEYMILIKSHDDVEKIDLTQMEIENEPVYLAPMQVSSFIDKNSLIIIRFSALLLLVIIFVVLLLLTIVGSGIGVMVDAFGQSKISFLPLLNLSGIIVSFYAIISFLLYYLLTPGLKFFMYIPGLIFCTIGLVVYLLERSSVPAYLSRSEKRI